MTLRGRSLSPHRQIWLLFAVAVVSVAAVVTGTMLVMQPAQQGAETLDTKLVPALTRLDTTSASYALSARTLRQAALEVAPNARNASFASLAAINSAGEAGWKAYLAAAQGLPGEIALQEKFEADRKLALDAGVAFVAAPPADSAAAYAQITALSESMLGNLDSIKGLYSAQSQQTLSDTRDSIAATQRDTLIFEAGALVVLLVAFGLAARGARAREVKLETLNRTLANTAARNDLETRLQRSLEMVHTEETSYDLINRVLTKAAPGLAAELLLADSSRAHFRQVTRTLELGGGGCSVMSPAECPATSRGQTQVWESSNDVDSCPYLQHRAQGDCSAVCVPVSIAGETVGVLHATTPDTEPPEINTIVNIELISRKAGERIGLLRAFSKSEVQAHTDPLTGLMNRRSLEVSVRALTDEDRPYVVAYGDLDHFKQLNDVYGHDAGDRALRLFARVVRDSLRPNDIPARYGGEEFVLVIPECPLPDAVNIINRLRARLATAQQGGTVPPFTVSFGVATSQLGVPFDDTIDHADAALLQAKREGRNRVVIAAPDNDDPEAVEPSHVTSEPRLVA